MTIVKIALSWMAGQNRRESSLGWLWARPWPWAGQAFTGNVSRLPRPTRPWTADWPRSRPPCESSRERVEDQAEAPEEPSREEQVQFLPAPEGARALFSAPWPEAVFAEVRTGASWCSIAVRGRFDRVEKDLWQVPDAK
jgi:hypothetical protein